MLPKQFWSQNHSETVLKAILGTKITVELLSTHSLSQKTLPNLFPTQFGVEERFEVVPKVILSTEIADKSFSKQLKDQNWCKIVSKVISGTKIAAKSFPLQFWGQKLPQNRLQSNFRIKNSWQIVSKAILMTKINVKLFWTRFWGLILPQNRFQLNLSSKIPSNCFWCNLKEEIFSKLLPKQFKGRNLLQNPFQSSFGANNSFFFFWRTRETRHIKVFGPSEVKRCLKSIFCHYQRLFGGKKFPLVFGACILSSFKGKIGWMDETECNHGSSTSKSCCQKHFTTFWENFWVKKPKSSSATAQLESNSFLWDFKKSLMRKKVFSQKFS